MATAPPPARQRFNPRGRAAALPSSYTTSRDTTAHGEPPLREQWASAGDNYIHNCAAHEPSECRALLEEIRALAAAYREAPLRERWAEAAFDYISLRATDSPDECRALLEEMRVLAEHYDEAPLREQWAKAANVSIDHGADRGPTNAAPS